MRDHIQLGADSRVIRSKAYPYSIQIDDTTLEIAHGGMAYVLHELLAEVVAEYQRDMHDAECGLCVGTGLGQSEHGPCVACHGMGEFSTPTGDGLL